MELNQHCLKIWFRFYKVLDKILNQNLNILIFDILKYFLFSLESVESK